MTETLGLATTAASDNRPAKEHRPETGRCLC